MVSVSSPFIPSLVTELMVEFGGRQITSKSSFLMKLKASVLKRGFVGRMSAKPLESCPTLCDPVDVAHQDPLSMGFSRQEHWSGLPFPAPGDLPDSGIQSFMSLGLAGRFFTTSATCGYDRVRETETEGDEDLQTPEIGSGAGPQREVAVRCVLARECVPKDGTEVMESLHPKQPAKAGSVPPV